MQDRPADEAADNLALHRLALWATRYTPTASPWLEADGAGWQYGFFLDIEGAAHLLGGEQKLIEDLAARLEHSFGLKARIAVASTPGAAFALARFHATRIQVLPAGDEAPALAPLPVEALRLTAETCIKLRRLGFKTIGKLIAQPRAPFAARFPAELLRRVDQALGYLDEPLAPVTAAPLYHSLRYLLEPLLTQDAVVALAHRLMQNLVHVLTRDGVGARVLRLMLYRVDGAVEAIDIGLTLPTRDTAHVRRLIDLKLEKLAAMQHAGFGFEAVGLAVIRAEPIVEQQRELHALATDAGFADSEADSETENAALIDKLRQRLGERSVRRFAAVASHVPERAEMLVAAVAAPAPWTAPQPRPLLMLSRAEPAEVTALIPDGSPRRLSWRGVNYEIVGAQGPERIGAEWWRAPPEQLSSSQRPGSEGEHGLTRDYYLVEDTEGRRFWLFREGLYGRETAAARWFVQGMFG